MKVFALLLLILAFTGCGSRSVEEQQNALHANVTNNLSGLQLNTNDPTRGRDPNARKDAAGETGVGPDVRQKAGTNSPNP